MIKIATIKTLVAFTAIHGLIVRGVHGSGTRTKRDLGSGTQNFGSEGWRPVPELKIIGYLISGTQYFRFGFLVTQ